MPDRAAFLRIGELSDELGVPQHVLRFWQARFQEIRPLQRAGGRRLYRPSDLDLIKGIQRLLHGGGYSIRGAQRILKEHGVNLVQAIGRGEAEIAPSSPGQDEAEAFEGLRELPLDLRQALERALHDPVATRRLAEACLAQAA